MKTATIFDIQRFSIHDGPGIRTTVFFKGCNLRCFWCHNPESLEPKPEIQFLPIKCIGCGKCFTICPRGCHIVRDSGERIFDRSACVSCGACAAECYAGALSVVGKTYTADEVLDVVLRDLPFYKSTGGMTCSGGEPLLQYEFAAELLEKAKSKGIHTAVDTAGNVAFERFEKVMPYTDLFLFDLKCSDDAAHMKATGAGVSLIHENLRRLSEAGATVWVRVPVIPTINNTAHEMLKIADLVKPLDGVRLVELLSFHKLGGGKYESLGKPLYQAMDLNPPEKEEMSALAGVLESRGINVKTP